MSVNIRNKIYIFLTYRRLALGASGKLFLSGICFMLFCFGVARSQSVETRTVNNIDIKPLSIGGKIPDELWNLPLQVVNEPEGKKTITLAGYKDKLIILDFWATWCAPCIKNFPKLHALQNEFGDKIKVLAVTKEDTDILDKFFLNGAGKDHKYVHSAINDNIISQYFPHNGLPHIVWIDSNGTVLNTTLVDEVTKPNIQAVLNKDKLEMESKIDIDRNKPLFLSENFGKNMALKNYSIFAKGYYPGLASGGRVKKNDKGVIYGRQITNLPMMDIYYPILSSLFEKHNEKFNLKRAVIEVKDPSQLYLIPKSVGGYEISNLYNYELIIPESEADSLYAFMLADLNRYSNYKATIEKREVECLVLIKTSNENKIATKGGKIKNTFPRKHSILQNLPIDYMLVRLNGSDIIQKPIINETGYNKNVDIEIQNFTDLKSLKNELNKNGLDLEEVRRPLNMFVLRDK